MLAVLALALVVVLRQGDDAPPTQSAAAFQADCDDVVATGALMADSMGAHPDLAGVATWADVPTFGEIASDYFRAAGAQCGADFVRELARADVTMGLVGVSLRAVEFFGNEVAAELDE